MMQGTEKWFSTGIGGAAELIGGNGGSNAQGESIHIESRYPPGDVHIGVSDARIVLKGTATLNGKQIATVDMLPHIDHVTDHTPLLLGLVTLGGVFGALCVGLAVAGWRGLLNRLRLRRIRAYRKRQARPATGPFR